MSLAPEIRLAHGQIIRQKLRHEAVVFSLVTMLELQQVGGNAYKAFFRVI